MAVVAAVLFLVAVVAVLLVLISSLAAVSVFSMLNTLVHKPIEREVLITELDQDDVFHFGGYLYSIRSIGLGDVECFRISDEQIISLPANAIVVIYI